MQKEQWQKILAKNFRDPKSQNVFSFKCFKFVHYALYPASFYKNLTFTPSRLPGDYSSI